MQQRQLRLGDILDDYCPRERRVTNHAVVAMVGSDVKQTRCTTCEAEHVYKHAKVPRQRPKSDKPAALYAQVLAGAPKRVAHEPEPDDAGMSEPEFEALADPEVVAEAPVASSVLSEESRDERVETPATGDGEDEGTGNVEEGPVHRPLIRATLPRPDSQSSNARPAPEFTIRQPAKRQNRFRPRHAHAGQQFSGGNRWNGSARGGSSGGTSRSGAGRPPVPGRLGRHHGSGRKRSK
jgi:hypothetical protein